MLLYIWLFIPAFGQEGVEVGTVRTDYKPARAEDLGREGVEDSLRSLFERQLVVFPQEKLYLHTDKTVYITGEKIWLRAHLADAATHIPLPVSQYVYVELFNPLDSLVARVKIRKDNDAYHGYVDIPPDIPEGDYTLRAYTNFMLSLDEHYLFHKTIHVANPKNRLMRVDAKFSFEEDGTTNVDFYFSGSSDSTPVVPKEVRISINGGKTMSLTVDDDGTAGARFTMPGNVPKSILLLEVMQPFYELRRFISIPVHDNDFDVGFYPEGGSLLRGIPCRVAFKAQLSNSRSANIQGAVYDQTGREITQIKTEYMGMGSFTFIPAEGSTYYAVCAINDHQSKRFELPSVIDEGYALSVRLLKDHFSVSVLKPVPDERQEPLYLLANARGITFYAAPWDAGQQVINLPKKQFPSGVLHLILFDSGLNPVSERLVFVNNDDQAQASYRSDRDSFASRSLVNNLVTLIGDDGLPLKGSFSVSVTADNMVKADSTANILTQLLLTSDLRGSIENPFAYFRNNRSSSWALDLLMLTQGWRRYDVSLVAKGQFSRPLEALELGPVVSGRVKRLFRDKPVAMSQVTIASENGTFFNLAVTDSVGRFSFNIKEQPDSTNFIVQAVTKSGLRALELFIDGEDLPEKKLIRMIPTEVDKKSLEQYVEKSAPKSQIEEDIKLLALSEVTVSARKPLPKSVFRATYVMDEEWIQALNKNRGVFSLIEKIPGIEVIDEFEEEVGFDKGFGSWGNVKGRRQAVLYRVDLKTKVPIASLTIDDQVKTPLRFNSSIVYEMLEFVVAENVKQIYLSAMFLTEVHLIIICNDLNKIFFEKEMFNTKIIQPFGYQQPAAFYAPKYDTPESKENKTPDLRSTIFWQPVVQTDDTGVASFDFYIADEATSYSVVIEGLTDNGKIIRIEGKLWRE